MLVVVDMVTGEPVGELTKDFRVKGGVLKTRDGPLKLPRELMLMDSSRDGDTIKDGFTMVRPGQRFYRRALDDFLTMEGLEIRGRKV
jgi:hypothetical protein